MNTARNAWVRSYHTSVDPLTRATKGPRSSGYAQPGGRQISSSEGSLATGGSARKSVGAARRFFVTLAAVCLVAFSVVALAARERVAAMVPFMAPAYAAIGLPANTRGLAIQDVHARSGEAGEKKYLMIEGWIVNLRAAQTTSPDLRIALRGSDGAELYVWTARAPRRRLERAERVRFAARLEAPPDAAKDAIVRFVDAGAKATPGAEGS
jgi:hypothetical protein